jgi:crotonobetainyl-CoA:carnitine CoA-transferase CaiB-like acyl-CoA transferase
MTEAEAAADSTDLPLRGLRILDVASFIAAPVAATVLGDNGADVIKVEPVIDGDPNRLISVLSPGYPKCSVNYPWHLDSRGKRSLAIDLKNVAARALFDRLIASADVLITNDPASSRTRLRLTYEDVAKVNARLIYASLTAYGESGPDADQMGFDINAYFARSGIYDGSRYDDAVPRVSMPAQGDRAAGIALATGIMIALWKRERTGRGSKVASSLLANGMWANADAIQAALLGGSLPKRPPPERPRSALSNVYRSGDERWFQLTLVREDRDWPALCQAIGREDLMNDARFADIPRRRSNAPRLAAILGEIFASCPFAHWRARLKANGLAFALIARAQDFAEDEQAMAAGILLESANPEMPRSIAAPFSIADVKVPPARPGPAHGAHSAELLREAGIGWAEIAALTAAGALR